MTAPTYLRAYGAPRFWTAEERAADLCTARTAAGYLGLPLVAFRALGLRPVATLDGSPRWSTLELDDLLRRARRRREWSGALRAVVA